MQTKLMSFFIFVHFTSVLEHSKRWNDLFLVVCTWRNLATIFSFFFFRLILRRGENRSTWGKTSQSREENQQTQPTYDAESQNRARATLVGGECSRHCATTAGNLNIFLLSTNQIIDLWRDLCRRPFLNLASARNRNISLGKMTQLWALTRSFLNY